MNRRYFCFLILSVFFLGQSLFCGSLESSNAVWGLENDTLAEYLKDEQIEKPYVNLNYDYTGTKKIPVKIFIKERIKSEADLYEGQEVTFISNANVRYKNRILIKEGEPVKAKVGMIIKSGMNGIPASVIFDSFEIQGIEQTKLSDTLEIHGQDRSLLVFPLKWALTFLPPTGSLTNFIKGGHVRLRTGRILTIYYYPQWH